jgi:hypothetical protein
MHEACIRVQLKPKHMHLLLDCWLRLLWMTAAGNCIPPDTLQLTETAPVYPGAHTSLRTHRVHMESACDPIHTLVELLFFFLPGSALWALTIPVNVEGWNCFSATLVTMDATAASWIGAGKAISGSTTCLPITLYPLRASVTGFRLRLLRPAHAEETITVFFFFYGKTGLKSWKPQQNFGFVFEAAAPSPDF